MYTVNSGKSPPIGAGCALVCMVAVTGCASGAAPEGFGMPSAGMNGGPQGMSGGSGGTGASAPSNGGDASTADNGGDANIPGSGINAGGSGNGAGDAGSANANGGGSSGDGGTGFRHPGILNSKAELDFVKQQVQAGAQPWKLAFDQMQSSSYASLSYTAHPVATVGCGAYSNPDIGCSDEKNDVVAAYSHALLWYLTGNEANAKKAIEIMNAWSAVLQGHNLANAPLQSGWVGSVWPRAAEIIRYTYGGWAPADVQRFVTMLQSAYVPFMTSRWCHNVENWELSFVDALTQISVFCDDRALFDSTVAWWREWVHAAFYLTADGPTPYYPTTACSGGSWSWFGQNSNYVDGICEETCRDLGHTQYGIAAMINAAETALHQGVDLYSEQTQRMTATMEFHAGFLTGQPVPSTLCGGTLTMDDHPTWEIGYNHFHGRLGMNLPFTKKLIDQIRPTGTSRHGVDHHMVWETLTHAELGHVPF